MEGFINNTNKDSGIKIPTSMDADDRETEHQESRATAGRYGNTSAKCANHTQTASSPFILGKVCRGSPK